MERARLRKKRRPSIADLGAKIYGAEVGAKICGAEVATSAASSVHM